MDRHSLGYVSREKWLASKPTLEQAYAQAGYGQSAMNLYRNMLAQWQDIGHRNGYLATTGGSTGSSDGGSSYPGIPPAFQAILDRIDAAEKSAREANERRYAEGLGVNDRMQAVLDSISNQEKSDAAQRVNNSFNAGYQDLISRGLSGSTLLPSLRMGADRDLAAEEARINDRAAREKIGVLENRQNWIGAREDEGPNVGLYASLLEKLASGYGGYSGGGSGGYRSAYSLSAPSGGRARPWSPNWNMNQGMSYRDAVATASGWSPGMSGSARRNRLLGY